jgi:hypothetical protein
LKLSLAKAGKRSEKAIKEVEEKIAKEERKEKGRNRILNLLKLLRTVKKGPKPVTRPLIQRRGKNYQKAAEFVDKAVIYPLYEALEIAVKTNPSKFDASLEVHVRLGVDPRQADQNIRATVSLPNGTGKTYTGCSFAHRKRNMPLPNLPAPILLVMKISCKS